MVPEFMYSEHSSNYQCTKSNSAGCGGVSEKKSFTLKWERSKNVNKERHLLPYYKSFFNDELDVI